MKNLAPLGSKRKREEDEPPPPAPPPPPPTEGKELRVAEAKKRVEDMKIKIQEKRAKAALAIAAKKKERAQVKAQIMFDRTYHHLLKGANVDTEIDHATAQKVLDAGDEILKGRDAIIDGLKVAWKGLNALKKVWEDNKPSS